MQIEPIAHIHTDFPTKFGVPRQSGLASELTSTIVFAPAYRNPDCLRGIADFSHLWLIWEFDKVAGAGWSPTVLPPKLGGQDARGRVCHALAVPAEPAGALVRAASKGRSCTRRTGRSCTSRAQIWSTARRSTTLSPTCLRRQPSGRRRRLRRQARRRAADRRLPAGAGSADPGEQTRRPPSGARLRPHPRLPARPDAPLRLQLLRPRRPLPHPGPHPHRGGDRPVIKGPPRGAGVPILA